MGLSNTTDEEQQGYSAIRDMVHLKTGTPCQAPIPTHYRLVCVRVVSPLCLYVVTGAHLLPGPAAASVSPECRGPGPVRHRGVYAQQRRGDAYVPQWGVGVVRPREVSSPNAGLRPTHSTTRTNVCFRMVCVLGPQRRSSPHTTSRGHGRSGWPRRCSSGRRRL